MARYSSGSFGYDTPTLHPLKTRDPTEHNTNNELSLRLQYDATSTYYYDRVYMKALTALQ